MKAQKHTELERERLSDGRAVWLSKFGRKFNVCVSGLDNEAPAIYDGMTKGDAYTLFADILRADSVS